MKLILTQEVTGLGAPGDVVDVAPGYGRNYLIPRGFAMRWTRGAEKQVEQIKRARAVREIRTLEEAQAAAGRLEKLTVRLKRRAGTNGRLFGSVGSSDIAEAVQAAGGPDVDRRKIVVVDPIKTAGSHRVQIRLHPEVTASVKIDVQAADPQPLARLSTAFPTGRFRPLREGCC
jgi:large subunit ribosomal protein L9